MFWNIFNVACPFRSSVAVRDSRGMHERREHLPSPVKRRILWSSQLKGMERPVQTFKSFVRSVPPNPGAENDKPLPPTPTSGQSLSPLLSPPTATSTESAWKAPTEWEWDNPSPPSQIPTTSIFAARNYSPLIPEPSPGLSSMQSESNTWPFETSTPQRLDPIRERSKSRPSTPPRNPSRPAPLCTPSTETDTALPVSSPDYSHSLAVPTQDMGIPDSPVDLPMRATLTPSSDFTYRISDASTKAKAYASLGIGSPRSTKTVWEDWSNNSNSPHAEADTPTVRSLRSNKCPPHNQTSPLTDDGLDDTELSDKMQLLSFSHDYHNVLADQYHQSNTQPVEKHEWTVARSRPTRFEMPRAIVPSHNHELMLEPLAWRKWPDEEYLDNLSTQIPSKVPPIPDSQRKHKRIASWTSHRHLNADSKRSSADKDLMPGSTSDSSVSRRKHIHELGVDKIWRGRRMPNISSYAKGLRPTKRREKATGVANSEGSLAPSSRLPPASPPVEHRSPFIRLPGGFALVRHSPSTTAHSETPSIHDISPLDESEPTGTSAGSLISTSDHPWRRSSWYSQHSQAEVAPAVAVNHHQVRDSFGSLPSRYSRSDNSSLPTPPLAHEIPLPSTPRAWSSTIADETEVLAPLARLGMLPSSPPRTNKLPPTSSPLPQNGRTYIRQDHANDITDEEFFGGNLLNKARDVRDAWKRHQRDAKHDKLKQSIRVLGPTDPTVAAGYVRREGRRSGDERNASGRMPGYMVSGPL
jgi:hypothetical protein